MYNLQGIKELYDRVCRQDDMTAYQQLFLALENPLITFIKALVGVER